jgi:hypothetical protein
MENIEEHDLLLDNRQIMSISQNPQTPQQIIDWLEAVARCWNIDPTPFEWGGARTTRRERSYRRHHALGGSGA